jgi:hypothetical protein
MVFSWYFALKAVGKEVRPVVGLAALVFISFQLVSAFNAPLDLRFADEIENRIPGILACVHDKIKAFAGKFIARGGAVLTD